MSILDQVDATTNLSKNNEVQLLVFQANSGKNAPYYAINVFKTREVVEAKNHRLTKLPSSNPLLEGTITLRKMQIPILNLPAWLGIALDKKNLKKSNLLICDFNGIVIGLRIISAYRVVKRNWNEMHAPDSYRVGEGGGVVINDTRLEDGTLCLILDYEKLLADVIPQAMVDIHEGALAMQELDIPQKLLDGIILIAEDSKTAQHFLTQILLKANLKFKIFNNGKLLLAHINSMEDTSDISVIITDIEMPEISGFTVIKNIRQNHETENIPIIVNSSMTGDNNRREAMMLGADGFIEKTKSKDLIPLIVSIMHKHKIL